MENKEKPLSLKARWDGIYFNPEQRGKIKQALERLDNELILLGIRGLDRKRIKDKIFGDI